MIRALTLLNETGDVTIVWEPENDEKVIPVIEKMMARGIAFFIIEPRLGGVVPPDASKPLMKAKDALKHRALAMREGDFEALVTEGQAQAIKTPDAPVKTVRKAKTAREVATSQTVAVQPRRGG